MSLKDHIIATYRFNLWFAKRLVEDITEEEMIQQPKPGMNHGAWILGHLSMERVFVKDLLKADATVPPGWAELFMPGSTPVAERAKYPSKVELLAALEASHAAVEAAFAKVTEADFEKETSNERMRAFFPKVGDVVVGLLTSHAGFHVGQLSAWRRAPGISRCFEI